MSRQMFPPLPELPGAEIVQLRPDFHFKTFTPAQMRAYAIEYAHLCMSEPPRALAALRGLLHRHCDGSDERYWAEWDDAQEAIDAVMAPRTSEPASAANVQP